jgi:hypothetical protein
MIHKLFFESVDAHYAKTRSTRMTADRIVGIRITNKVTMPRFLVSGFLDQRTPKTRDAPTTSKQATSAGTFTPSNPVHSQSLMVNSSNVPFADPRSPAFSVSAGACVIEANDAIGWQI